MTNSYNRRLIDHNIVLEDEITLKDLNSSNKIYK